MRTFSPALSAALAAPVKKPVWLLKIDLRSNDGDRTLYLSDRPITLWGAEWKPLVTRWGAVDRYFDPSENEIRIADVTVELINGKEALGPGERSASWLFRKYDLADSVATLYLWLDDAGLTPPSGEDQNDLLTILTGRPELSSEITPSVCPLDIVSVGADFAGDDCPWGDLLQGRYTKNQWGALPDKLEGAWKPAVFGDDALCEGVALSAPVRAGAVAGPDALFDPATGSATVVVSFPESGEVNASKPYPAPFDMYVGDWRLTVKQAPAQLPDGTWEYRIHSDPPGANFYLPTPLKGATPLFANSPAALWPRPDESGDGPHASSEPPMGAPYQLYHGPADTGNWRDGAHPGRAGAHIKKVFIDGVEAAADEVVKDDGFGIVWLRSAQGGALGKAGNPETLCVKWTGLDTGFNTGDAWLHASQLTALNPYGYNAQSSPCILGDFAIPASGGGAPVTTKLGLVHTSFYPPLGARLASARLVIRYTGPLTSAGDFNVTVFGTAYSFSASELTDGAGIAQDGWWIVKNDRGSGFEIWPDNDGYPYTQTSPDPRQSGVWELSRDVTDGVLASLGATGGISTPLRIWFSGTQWPDENSVILLSAELELAFDPVEAVIAGPRVTGLVGGAASTAGEIIAQLIPSAEIGTGFDDPSLPNLKYRVDRQRSVCAFIKTVTGESDTQIRKNLLTGKWDLVRVSSVTSNLNPPPYDGGEAVITQDDLLAGEDGLPMIRRSRSAPDTVINEVTVRYVDENGKQNAVTLWDQGSVDIHGIRRHAIDLGASITREVAEDYALAILNDHAEMSDFYTMTFPLGPKLALEPNDIIAVTADMDDLSATKMRVVSVEADPGSLAEGIPSTVTVNARRYSKARRGYGGTAFGTAPFGGGETMEN